VRLVQAERTTWRHALALGTLLGLSLLTKLTTLFLVPLALATVLPAPWRPPRRQRAVHVGGALAIALALCSWAFVRNHRLYGDALAMNVHDAAFQVIPTELRWHVFVDGFLPNVFTSLLGTFGWFSLPPHPALVWTGAAVAALALLGLVRITFDRERAGLPRPLCVLLLTMALVFAGTAYFNWKAPQPQGRLLFPAIGPAAVLLAAGLVRVSAGWRRRRWLVALLPLTAALLWFAWFRPAFAIELAPAPAWHRSLVGGIAEPRGAATIVWREIPANGTAAPRLRWSDPDAPTGTRYTLYAVDDRGRVWLATHEWTHGAMIVQGAELTVPPAALAMLPLDVSLTYVLRRVPATANDVPAMLPVSAPLPFQR